MKMSPLSQFDVICIIPFWIGNNEISLTNLSLTVMFVVLIKTEMNKLYSNLKVLRNFQVISILNFSISDINLGSGKYLNKLNNIQVLKLKKNTKVNFQDANSVYNQIEFHPFIPSVFFKDNKFFILLSNLTTKKKNAIFLAKDSRLHNTSAVFLYHKPKFILLDDKIKIDNISLQLQQSNIDIKLSNVLTNDSILNKKVVSLLDKQVKDYLIEDNYLYFEGNDILDTLIEVKKIVD